MIDTAANMLERLNHHRLNDVFRDFGIDPPPAMESASWEPAAYRLTETGAVERFSDGGSLGVVELAQAPIGVPGTYIIDGRIEVEHNARVRPYQARGRLSRPGLNEEIYRTEPVAFKSVNEIGALICNAAYEPHIPDDVPPAVVKEINRQHAAIRRAMLQDDVLVNASSFLKHGFALFEVVWNDDTTVKSILFREQSTIDRWLFDERQSEWVGTEFRTGSPSNESYIIPNGTTLATARSMLVNLHATGNNLEGVSPIRVITGLRKLKELVLQAYGVSYQKYAVPIAMIVHESIDASAAILGQAGNAESKEEVQKLVTRLQDLRSRLGAVLKVPEGFRVEYVNPSNDMPDPRPLLDYLDMMMALVFANEGALLGNQSFGSYAMAAVSDAKFMRSAPVYAERITSALTKVLHTGLRLNLGDKFDALPELPRYSFRFNGTQDASRYLADLAMTMNARPDTWPEEVRRAAAARLGLPVNAFDELEQPVTGGDDATPSPDGDLQRSALNGAQVTSMVDVVQQVAAGLLPKESAIRILMRAFNMGRIDAAALVNPAATFEQKATPSADPDPAAEIAETVTEPAQ